MQIGNCAPFSYSMLDISTNSPLEIAEVEEMKNLRVWCTNDLKPSLLCWKAAAKAMQVFYFYFIFKEVFSIFFS